MTPPRNSDCASRLQVGRVLIVGVGGLGHPAALGLAAAGVGTLGLVDADRIDISNLPRQLLFSRADIGKAKASTAAAKLQHRFPRLKIEAHDLRLTAANASDLFAAYDFIIDATDRAASKFLVNDAAVRLGRPLSHAGVVGERGQTMTILPGRSCCLRCLFPQPPREDEIATCEEAGVLGPLVGTFGYLQAGEAVKHLSGKGRLLADKLLTVACGRWRTVALRRDPHCTECGARGAQDAVPPLSPR